MTSFCNLQITYVEVLNTRFLLDVQRVVLHHFLTLSWKEVTAWVVDVAVLQVGLLIKVRLWVLTLLTFCKLMLVIHVTNNLITFTS
jgi:hypothetical protein